jgi:hypothetical protein
MIYIITGAGPIEDAEITLRIPTRSQPIAMKYAGGDYEITDDTDGMKGKKFCSDRDEIEDTIAAADISQKTGKAAKLAELKASAKADGVSLLDKVAEHNASKIAAAKSPK